jgi:TRAP-type mannitol/chloroaromatic compound transport system substrate-binding protein
MINKARWDALSDSEKAMLVTACRANYALGMAEGEAIQGKALAELESKGVTIHSWDQATLDKLEATWAEVAAEIAASDASFKEAWDSLQAFRAEYKKWSDVGYLK